MRAGRTLLAVAALTAPAALVACASLVGVEDVRLRRDGGARVDGSGGGESGADADAPVLENVLEVALGLAHTCARKPDLTVKCWGDDSAGQTGTGGASDGGIVLVPAPVNVTDAVRIASGKNHTCVVHAGGTVSCWGDDFDGQLGDGKTNTRSNVPVDVTGVTGATAIACGASFSCAVLASGGVTCWGNGLAGQLGNGGAQVQPTATPVTGLDHVVAMTAGESHACAVKDDGSLLCWGDGFDGQLGNGEQQNKLVPTPVPAISDVRAVAGGARSTCALKNTGEVYCWGENSVGQLGSGAANSTPNPSPSLVGNLDAVALWAGADHACAVRRGGAVSCWGLGEHGQIGDGQARDAGAAVPQPTGVLGVSSAVKIGTGGNHSCATTPNTILCWGANDRGQLGTGVSGGDLLSPESVMGYP
ncbi:MAG: hypothetical protein JWP97_3227 [Labilithrix sp.]|nr:hypothetical protein [Labilithrix sp.]